MFLNVMQTVNAKTILAMFCLEAVMVGWVVGSEQAESVHELHLEGASWAFQVSLPGYELEYAVHSDPESGVAFEAVNEESGMFVSAFVEAKPKLRSVEECRDFYLAAGWPSPILKSHVRFFRSDDALFVEWTVEDFGGKSVDHRNLFMYLWRDRHCIDVHMSKMRFTSIDEHLFREVLASLRFSDEAVDRDRRSKPEPLRPHELTALLKRDEIRLPVLEALKNTPDPDAADRLLRIVSNARKPAPQRMSAAEALAVMGRLKGMIQLLGDDDAGIRKNAARRLTHVGAPAVEPLISALRNRNPKVRANAAWALGELEERSAVDGLRRATKDSKKEVRSAAVAALARIGDASAVAPLAKQLRDRDPTVALDAAHSLGKLGGPAAVEILIKALSNSHGGVRLVAAQSLGSIGDPAAVLPLVQFLLAEEPKGRRIPALALGRIGRPALESLLPLLDHDDPTVRSAAALALTHIPDRRTVDAFVQKARQGDLATVAGAHRFFIRVAVPGSEPMLVAALEAHGDIHMANAFKGCGNATLSAAADLWAELNDTDFFFAHQAPKWGSANSEPNE